MGAQVVSFLNWSHRAAPQPVADWSQQELAEFYRVESALIRAGLSIETDRGLSDEGDPWFVFLRAEDGEVVVHFARVDGEYLIAGPAYEKVARGYDFNALVRAMIARHPLIRPEERGANILLHPAAILVAIVGTAFFKTGEAKAMDNDHRPARKPTAATASGKQAPVSATPTATDHIYMDANQALTIMAGALFAMEPRWDRKEQLAGSAHIQAEGVTARADLHNANFADAQDLKFEGLKADVPHPTALALATAQAPTLLAVTALLSEVANSHAGESMVAQPLRETVAPVLSETAGTNSAAVVYLDVQLRAGAMPNAQSAELLREVLGTPGFEKIAVVAVDKIPEAIADVIAHGGGFTVGAAPITDGSFIVTPDITSPENVAPITPTTPATGDAASPTDHVTPPTVDTSAPPAAPAVDATKAFAQSLIDYFVAHVPNAEVMTSGLEVVFYDSRVLDHPEALNHVDAMTFHFSDGSSISLVGEHSTLYRELA
jgi:hypothetical protein